MKRLAFVLALTGCSSPPKPATPAPAAAQPDCNAAVATTARFLAQRNATAADAERVKATVALHCVEDHWTAATTTCVGGAQDQQAAHTCLRETLTVTQHENIMAALKDAAPSSAHDAKPAETITSAGSSQVEIAAKLNDEGKELMFKSDWVAATMKFRDAVARVPEPKYYFNLCMALYSDGKFGEAMTACQASLKNQPDPVLRGKVEKLIERVKKEAKSQGIVLKN